MSQLNSARGLRASRHAWIVLASLLFGAGCNCGNLVPAGDGGAPGTQDGGDAGSQDGGDGDAGMEDAGTADDGGLDGGAEDAGGCGDVGRACGTGCPSGMSCQAGASGGFCAPDRPGCGGFAGATCDEPAAPFCLTLDGTDFGPCVSAAERACVCGASPGAVGSGC